MDTEGWIEVLKERIEGIRLQLGRLVSHFDSEQRTSVRQGKDIDKLIIDTEHMEAAIDELKKEIEKRDERRHTNWKDWISIILAAAAVLIAIFK